MQALVGAGGVAASAEDVAALANLSRSDKDFCADGIAWTLRASDELKRHPVIRILHDVAEQRRRGVDVIQYHVDVPVVVRWPPRLCR
jgi:hypothetical protein